MNDNYHGLQVDIVNQCKSSPHISATLSVRPPRWTMSTSAPPFAFSHRMAVPCGLPSISVPHGDRWTPELGLDRDPSRLLESYQILDVRNQTIRHRVHKACVFIEGI